MPGIKIEKVSEEKLRKMGVFDWPVWEKEISRFDWYYDTSEMCYILEGSVTVECEGGEKASFGPGDFVTFPKGLKCVWDITSPVRKHYKFK